MGRNFKGDYQINLKPIITRQIVYDKPLAIMLNSQQNNDKLLKVVMNRLQKEEIPFGVFKNDQL